MEVDGGNSSRRQVTRRALLDAARDLVFERGHDRVSVQEITSRARVATGTYYNYFQSKQDIFIAVAEDMRDQLAADLEDTRNTIKDPAMLVAMTLRYYFHQARDNREWHEFTRYTGLTDMCLQQPAEQATADITRGVKGGRFRVDDVSFTQTLIAGMVNHVNLALKHGQTSRHTVDYAIRSILQMLGLPELVSRALTQTPLPPIAAGKRVRNVTISNVTPIADYARDTQESGQTAN